MLLPLRRGRAAAGGEGSLTVRSPNNYAHHCCSFIRGRLSQSDSDGRRSSTRQAFLCASDFAAGMFLFAVEELLRGMSYGTVLPADAIYWQKRVIGASALIPAVWLAFSSPMHGSTLGICLSKWKWAFARSRAWPRLVCCGLSKVTLMPAPSTWKTPTDGRFSWVGPDAFCRSFSCVCSLLILFNLERTVRSSTGRMRWQIKFMALGVGLLFALRIYMASQQLLFSTVDTGFVTTNGVALIAANLLFAISLLRGNSLNVDVYLSTTAIQNSLTIILVGIYLLAVGVLAHVATYFSRNDSLPFDAFVIFISLTALAVLLLSDRLRRKLRLFVSRHFQRPIYDYRNVWMELTQRTTSLVDVA